MRVRQSKNGISVHAISGTHVVLLGLDATKAARKNLLGFAIQREDHIEDEKYWLKGFKTFKNTHESPAAGSLHSTLRHPIQSFLWGDYTAKPGYKYTFKIRPVYGKPNALTYGPDVAVTLDTEHEDDGEHAVYFNRGSITSQYYARKFGNKSPDVLNLNDPTTKWLSRGLIEAALAFISQAKDCSYALRIAAYELGYEPILKAFKAAADRGAVVEIVYEAGTQKKKGVVQPTSTTKHNEESIDKAGIRNLVFKRTERPAIPHNKFMILEKDGTPIEVWTGSTNFTSSGFLGQSNVGHVVRNKEIALQFKMYWNKLKADEERKSLKSWNNKHTPTPVGHLKENNTTLYFCPRKRSKMLQWYGDQIRNAKQTLMFTAAFGVSQKLAPAIAADKDFLRFLLIEKKLSKKVSPMIKAEKEIIVARGQALGTNAIRYKAPGFILDKWFAKEEHYRKRGHVFYVHSKILMLDVLTEDPLIFSGSANFSYNSLMNNDENMLLIRGNKRVADIYLGEFMRLFNHFYFRSIVNKLASENKVDVNKSVYLKGNSAWVNKHFFKGGYSYLRRELFK